VLLKKLVSFLSNLVPCSFIRKEALQVQKEIFSPPHLDGPSCFDEAAAISEKLNI